MMNHWKRWRGFLLVWLGSSLLFVAYAFLVEALSETPNWLDVLVFVGWAALASRWLGLVAERLQRRRAVRWVAIAVPSMALVVIALPWVLHLPVSGGLLRISDAGRYFLSLADLTPRSLLLTIPQTLYILQYLTLAFGRDYLQGTATITEHFQVAGLPLALGLGLTALALSWRVTWQALLSTPAIVNLWTRLYSPVQRVWTGLRRTRAWYWLRRGLAWGMIVLLILDGVGVLLTARPTVVEWEPVVTTGFPSGTPNSVRALTVGPDESLYAGTDGGGVFRSADVGQSWQAVNQGLTSLDVRALTVGPDERLYAGTDEGVFRSTDGGQSWQAANQGLTSLAVSALAVGPDGESIFAGTYGSGVFRSADAGQSWQAVNQGLTSLSVWALAVGPDERLYAGTFGGGVFRSAGGDETWQAVNAGLTDLDVSALAVGPDGESIFAGTLGGRVFRSDDGGETWQAINAGLTDLAVLSLAVGPDENLYAGTYYGGVFRSADGGQTWQTVNAGLTDLDVWALAVGPDGESIFAGTIGGGVFRSTDDGQSWQAVNQGLTSLDVRALTVGLDDSLYAGTSGGGVFRSADDGRSWQAINQGLTELNVRALTVGPDESLYAGTSGGVFRSTDDGQSWQAVNQGLTSLYVQTLTVGPDESLYAGTSGGILGGGGGVFRSTDAGQSWQAVNQGLTSLDVKALTMGPDERLYAGTGEGVFRSADDGQSWQAVNQGLTSLNVYALTVGPDERLYAGTWEGGVFRSADNGQSWQAVNQGLTALNVRTLTVGPDESLYAGTGGGVFRSADDGQSWQAVNQGLTDLNVYALTAGPDESLYAGTGEGVFRSADAGRSWQAVNQGLTSLDVRALTVGLDERLYAGTSGGGVFRSADDGRSWQAANQGLTDLNVYALTVGPDERLYAGTSGGVFRSADDGESWQAVNQGLTDLDVRALTVGSDENLYAGTSGGDVFRSADGGQMWQAAAEISTADLVENSVFGNARVAAAAGRVSLTRPGMGWLPWAAHRYQAPQAIAIRGNMATLYASAGAAMMLRAESPLPVIWRAPTLYLALVAATWSALYWIGANVVPLSVGLGLALAVVALYVYAGVARPNRLRSATVFWLLPRPRHLLAASAYRGYAARWAAGSSLERLILLQSPIESVFTPAELEDGLRALGVPFGAPALHSALSALNQRLLLLPEDGGWRLAESLLAEVQRRELFHDQAARLAAQARAEHPLCTAAHRFFDRAGFQVTPVENTLVYRCEPTQPALQRLLPGVVYARILPDKALDGPRVLAIQEETQRIDTETAAVFVVTDRRPTDQGWAQIGTLRMDGFVILPIEQTLLNTGLTTGREATLLHTEIEKRLGADYDPYDVRDPVAGAFSFFGRDALVEDLLRRTAEGRPVGVFGLRKMGKSSLLQALRDRSPFPVAAANLQTVGHAALDELYARILRYWAQWARVRVGMEATLPAVTSDDPTGSFVAATLALLEQLEQRQDDARLGLFLDEVELITPRPDGGGPDLQRYLTFLRAIRGLIDEDGRLSLVVASLNPSINRINAWNGEQNPTFNLFQEIYLSPLTKEDCIQMVRNIGRQVGLVYEDESVARIAEYSGGHPFLARQLCSLLYKQRGRQPGQIEAAAIPAAVEHFIYDEQTVTHLDAGIWQDAGNPALWGEDQARINQSLLLELARADGPVPQDRLLDSPDADLRRTALINLERFHFIHQSEPGAYALRYGLLRTWLRRRKLGLE